MSDSGDKSFRTLSPGMWAQCRASQLISTAENDPMTLTRACELYDLADALPPLTPQELIGEWSSGGFNTGNSTYHWLKSINWVGITFRDENDVEPIVVEVQTRDRYGTRKRWLDEWGNGQVVEAKYRGVFSAALFCDNHPLIGHFRKVSDTTLLGIMTGKMHMESGPFFFYLVR